MDFFQAQDESRRVTKILVFFFVLAVAAIILLANGAVLLALTLSDSASAARTLQGNPPFSIEAMVGVSLVVVALVAGGSLYRIWSLSGGGSRVAEMIGGQLLVDHGGDLRLRRLLNVVEEMAIASGTPVPPVYLIEDSAINAFAAGYSPGDAVIGITRGAVENLDRDQLQGVIAHEFSHILNGDMRLNIRLMGVLFGILMLAVIGRMLLSSGRGVAVGSVRRDRSGGGAAILGLGLGLLVIGFVGKFFGSVIKAAVSRQREFLADASAVQFTRNPEGIGGALMRIGGYSGGSVISHPEAEELSHAFFSEGVKTMFTSIMATHPPLKVRIARINPNWDGTFITEPPPAPAANEFGEAVSGFSSPGASSGIDADHALANIGQPDLSQLQQARQVLASIPLTLSEAAHEPYSARAVVYLVLLDRDPLVSSRQQDHLAESADVFVLSRFRELLPLYSDITDAMRLPLLEMALPSLRRLSPAQYDRFLANIDALIRADQKVGLSEWALKKYLTRNLDAAFNGHRSGPAIKSLERVADECAVLLSMLAYSDSRSAVAPAVAFEAGRRELELDVNLQDKSTLKLSRLDSAVDRLATLQPLRKPKVLKACIATITADRVVAPVEKELVRAIADAIDCPMPPLP